jgi:hypothetical protein
MRALLMVVAVLGAVALGQQRNACPNQQLLFPQYSNCSRTATAVNGSCFNVGSRCVDLARAANRPCEVGACVRNAIGCVLRVAADRNVQTESQECRAYGNELYLAQVGAAASSAWTNSTLYMACASIVCPNVNSTLCGDQVATICTRELLINGTVGPIASPVVREAIRVTLRISGTQWAALLNNPAQRAAAVVSLTTDIAKLLGVNERFVEIIDLMIGSLIVNFRVLEGSGRSPAALQSGVNTATSSASWLSTTQVVYRVVAPGETLAVTAVTVDATQAPTTLAPGQTNVPEATGRLPGVPSTSSAFGAAGVAAAALAAVVAMLA